MRGRDGEMGGPGCAAMGKRFVQHEGGSVHFEEESVYVISDTSSRPKDVRNPNW